MPFGILYLACVLALARVSHAQDQRPLYAPSLLFNWTLYPEDLPMVFNTDVLPIRNGPHSLVVNGTYIVPSRLEVKFMGSAIAIYGSAAVRDPVGPNGTRVPVATVRSPDDPTFDSTQESMVFDLVSESVLWQRATPRFQDYAMHLSSLPAAGNWTIEKAEVTTGMNTSAASLAQVPVWQEKLINDAGQLNPFYNLTGRWDVIPATDQLPAYAKCFDKATMNVTIPRGTAYMVLNGTRSPTSVYTRMTLEKHGDIGIARTIDYIPDVKWPYETEALFFMRTLNPGDRYSFIFECASISSGQQGLTGMMFYQGSNDSWPSDNNGNSNSNDSPTASSGASGEAPARWTTPTAPNPSNSPSPDDQPSGAASSGAKLSSGAIGGIVVGAIVGVVALGLLIWLYLARRRKSQAQKAAQRPPPHGGMPAYHSGPLVGEIDPSHMPTPYPMPRNDVYGYPTPHQWPPANKGDGTPASLQPPFDNQVQQAAPPSYHDGSVHSPSPAPYLPLKR